MEDVYYPLGAQIFNKRDLKCARSLSLILDLGPQNLIKCWLDRLMELTGDTAR